MLKMEIDVVREYYREVQCKLLIFQKELKQVAVDVQQYDKGIQNTICANLSDCQTFQKYSSTQEVKQIDANTMECLTNDMQNMIGIKLKRVECFIPNFLLISTDGNYLPSLQRDLKETINNCQKDTDFEQKGF